MSAPGRSLELYFVDGRPDGLLTAEVFNWTGHVLMAPRTRLRDALARREAAFTGVYLLLSASDEERRAYIGEAENVAARIRQHDTGKDWWQRLVVITTAADSLHKAHARYLEARLIETARAAHPDALDNRTNPPRASLSEAAQANMEEFLDTLHMVLPALGVDVFASRVRPKSDTPADAANPSADARFVLRTPKHDLVARAEVRGAEFVLLAGSRVRGGWESGAARDHGYRILCESLISDGLIDTSLTPPVLREDYAFTSPSAAAAVVNGRPANGRLEWKHDPTGKSYGEWEDSGLESADRP